MTTQFTVDHRYAQSQVRLLFLQHLTSIAKLEDVADRSGLAVQHLTAICLGRAGLPYRDMNRLIKALLGEQAELFVTMPWHDCGQSYSAEEPCPEDAANQRLLIRGQISGKIPLQVWPEKKEQP
jgi:hypothetical protein